MDRYFWRTPHFTWSRNIPRILQSQWRSLESREPEKTELENRQRETIHYLDRLEEDEQLVLAWMIQRGRDHFTFKTFTDAVKRLTGKGILISNDKVAFYREAPDFVWARVIEMEELRCITVPKIVPWEYEEPPY
jgi:hypothetical protein